MGLRLAAAAALVAVAASGCGLGPGPSSSGTARLEVTRDYGAQRIASARRMIRASRRPCSASSIETRRSRPATAAGSSSRSTGISGAESGGRRFDWFFYVNGVESPVGATQVRVHGGDRIWWDYRDWTAAMRVPAVVGSWPQPFAAAGARRIRSASSAPARRHRARWCARDSAVRASRRGSSAVRRRLRGRASSSDHGPPCASTTTRVSSRGTRRPAACSRASTSAAISAC